MLSATLGLFLVRTATFPDGSPKCIVQEGPMGPPRDDSYNHEYMLNAYGPLAAIQFRTGVDVDAMQVKYATTIQPTLRWGQL